jgi:glycine dehydrogenase subunit 2
MNALNPSGWRPGMGSGGEGQSAPTASGDRGLALEEALIFELGQPGTCGVDFDGEDADPAPSLARFLRKAAPALPGLSEPETVRHYTRLSRQNYAIDLGPFPLGSCTMKHNPRLNEKVARMPGFADLHPLQPAETVQGALGVIDQLAGWLVTLTGMDTVAMTSRRRWKRAAIREASCSSPKARTAPIRRRRLSPGSASNRSRRTVMAGSTWPLSPPVWGQTLPG